GVAEICQVRVVELNVSAACRSEPLELFAIASSDVVVEGLEIGIGLTADGSTATAKVEHGWRRDCYLWHALCDRLEKLKICELDRVRMLELRADVHHRRREVHVAASTTEARLDAAARLDAFQLLEKIDVKVGAPELPIGDALQTEVLLETDDVADG